MQKIVLLSLLGLCTWEDIRKKEVTVIYILLFGIGGVILHLFSPSCSIYSVLWGISLGLFVMVVSVVSRGGIGMGDGILLAVTGVYLGGTKNLELFVTGLLLSSIWAVILVAFRKKKGKEPFAFVPFLLASYLAMMVRWSL